MMCVCVCVWSVIKDVSFNTDRLVVVFSCCAELELHPAMFTACHST